MNLKLAHIIVLSEQAKRLERIAQRDSESTDAFGFRMAAVESLELTALSMQGMSESEATQLMVNLGLVVLSPKRFW
jgi:hypothetical protein